MHTTSSTENKPKARGPIKKDEGVRILIEQMYSATLDTFNQPDQIG